MFPLTPRAAVQIIFCPRRQPRASRTPRETIDPRRRANDDERRHNRTTRSDDNDMTATDGRIANGAKGDGDDNKASSVEELLGGGGDARRCSHPFDGDDRPNDGRMQAGHRRQHRCVFVLSLDGRNAMNNGVSRRNAIAGRKAWSQERDGKSVQ